MDTLAEEELIGVAEIVLTDENFAREVLESEEPVMVDFWAEWCGPCRMLSPIVSELAQEHEAKVKVCKLNVDENPETASQFGIMSIPTVIFFKNGTVVNKVVGLCSKSDLKKQLDDLL